MAKELALNLEAELQLPAHLQGVDTGVGTTLMEAIGSSLNRIGTKGNRFRQVLRGEEVGVFDDNYLDVIIVGAAPAVSRKFYKGKYSAEGDNAPPACYSVDGVAPSHDVHVKQSPTCGTCPQNVKGSSIGDNGAKGRACSFFRRLVIILANDPSGTMYRLEVAAMGLFGESDAKTQKYSLNDYAKALKNRNLDAGQLVTRLSFDTDQSVPKLLFTPMRFISPEDKDVIDVINENPAEKEEYLAVSFKTVDISEEQAGNEAPPPASAPAAPPRAARAAKAPAPAPVVEETIPVPVDEADDEEAKLEAQLAAARAKKAAATATRVHEIAAASKPAAQRAAAPAAQRAAPAVAKAPAAAPAAVQEVGSDEELGDILGDLGL
jgi:hypothetical protein